jgi:hypothetical protein
VEFRLLYVWFIIDHGRRRITHFNVTANSTASWVIQQLREAFPYDSAPKYLIYDNDSIFSDPVTGAIEGFGIEPKRTAFQSPWQNGTAERWVGTCKREIIDHVIVFNEDHLRRLLREYVSYYNADRVHTVIQDAPEGRTIESRPLSGAKVIGLPRVTRKLRFLPSTIAMCGKRRRSGQALPHSGVRPRLRIRFDNRQPVPEPTALVLFGFGALMLGHSLRNRTSA